MQVAHIRPVTEGGDHRLENGLLLRSDVHSLFDDGYLSVDALRAGMAALEAAAAADRMIREAADAAGEAAAQ